MIRIIVQQHKKTFFNKVSDHLKNLLFKEQNKNSKCDINLEYINNSNGISRLKRNAYLNYGKKKKSFKLSKDEIINDEYLKILFKK